MTISEVKRRARVTEWIERIRDQQESGLSIRARCAAHDIKENRYYYWLRIIRSAAIEQAMQGSELIRVEPERLPEALPDIPTSATNEQRIITIRYGKAVVELPVGTPVTAIHELLKALDTP